MNVMFTCGGTAGHVNTALALAGLMKERDTAVNILVSFVCAVQVESFRKVNGHSVATTMCTGNLRSATEQIFHYVRTRDPDTKKTILSYYEIVVFFALGATLGAALSALFAEKAILFCCLFLIIAFLSMFAKEI